MDVWLPLAMAVIGGASAAVKGIADDALRSLYTALKRSLSDEHIQIPFKEIETAIEAGEPLEQVVARLNDVTAQIQRDEFRELVGHVCAKLDELKQASPSRSSALTLPLSIVLNFDQKVIEVKAHPIGPALKPGVFSANRLARSMSTNVGMIQSKAIVSDANALRVHADPDIPADAICLDGLPEPGFVGLYDYWYQAGDLASRLGPRMTSAILLVAPINVWNDYGAEAYQRLPKER